MQSRETPELADYLALCQREPGELDLLARDTLISVTRFWRDPAAFHVLSEAIADLVRRKPGHDPLRVWVAGCATGEEAYSVAMAFGEALGDHLAERVVQIYATDLDLEALALARRGLYAPGTLVDLPETLARRYFTPYGAQVEFSRQLRERVVFSRHDLTRDPPFPRMDLICCRNVLIYLKQDAQARVMRTFHYALQPHGLLFLGRSESVLHHEDLFAPLKMDSTSMGLRPDLDARHVRPDMRGTVPIKHLSRNIEGDHALFEDPQVEAPHVGCASTCGDLWRFAEMLRREGELDGARILSPRMIRLARKVHTGDKPNELYKGVALRAGWVVPPANQGLGFQVRGTGVFQHLFGQLASPETFGNYGAGSTLFWVDPEADVSFSFLSAGVMTQAANIERCGKLSDIALSACL